MRTVAEKVENVARDVALTSAKERLAAKVELVILADGSLESVKVVQTSGNDDFDQALIRVAKGAAPFDPFPEDIRKETDVLHIVRTWRYSPK